MSGEVNLAELYFIRAVLICLQYDTSPGAQAEREILFARIEEINESQNNN